MDLREFEDDGPRLTVNPQKMADELPDGAPVEKQVGISWLFCVGGWLCCAFMCLWLMIELEAWPKAYDMFFWVIILILFCNIFLFLFISSRAGRTAKQLFYAVLKLCAGEGLVLLVLYLLGRFAINA